MSIRLASVCLAALLPLGTQTLRAADKALERAEKLYREDHLTLAEPLYRQALDGATRVEYRRASDRLLTLYSRLGRYDLAIRRGLVYHDWLEWF